MKDNAFALTARLLIPLTLFRVACLPACAGTVGVARRLIPEPKECVFGTGELALVADGKSKLVVFTARHPDPKETRAAQWVAREITTLSGATPEITADATRIDRDDKSAQLILATLNRETDNPGLAAALLALDAADRALLVDPKRSEQSYVIRCAGRQIVVAGGSPQGTLYGAMTLLQLFRTDKGQVTLPRVHIRDWPDFRHRMAENWTYTEGRDHWGRGWLYDWGEGPDAYRKRVEGIFDRCLRYKINMICFSSGFGEPFSQMWDGDAFPLQKELNRLAAERGVKLMIGGYGIGAHDRTMLNRESYPGGQEYVCLTTRNLGNCRGNDELTRKIQDRFREYVRKTEPRALYIHHEDSDSYVSAQWLWQHRCDRCQKRWPNDDMAAADGAAGAFTHGYNMICDAIFSVRNADSGYDASRDCLVILVSPSYTASRESDATWDQQLVYWKTVTRLLKHRPNVDFCFREQFLRSDNSRKRILEMSEMLRVEQGPGIFLFFVSRASAYESGPLFVPVPAAMSRLNEGADVAYYMCGMLFQEPLILLNAAHMWNTKSLGACDVPGTAADCLQLYQDYAHRRKDPPGISGAGGFLELACRTLYGERAGKKMEQIYALKTPMPICYARGLFAWAFRKGLYHDWTPELKTTREALGYVETALREPDCKPESRPIVERLRKCLRAGEQYAQIRVAYQQLAPLALDGTASPESLENRATAIQAAIAAMERYLKQEFSYQWATPRGGDVGVWAGYLGGLRGEVAQNVKKWGEAIRASQTADRIAAAGGRSLVVNGDMATAVGWTFTGVTAEEDTGYAEGGYVADRVTGGRRAYRIIKLPVQKLSHKWPMPERVTWGEIQQVIAVQPGRKHAVAFEVFNNYGLTDGHGVLEHQVLIDEREMWSLDASAPKGWKRGGFHFVPKTTSIRLRLRTTDVRPCGGWRKEQGDSWWSHVRIYPVMDEVNEK